RTLVLIKPDAIQNGHKDEIIKIIEENGFKIIQEREIHLSKKKARSFYKEHAGKNFYKKLIDWMNSVPIYAMVLEKDNAIQDWKELIGPTDAKKARETKPHSIRALFGTDGLQNAVHGSDSEESVKREIEILFG
ncbi:nucleoside-diphosphate kinase, partial [Mycotypha africana]|uniref:nucleoside-diphosphate kinase n=1 Tax=Mycotypha africana TaxID=64632 RepID=UPI0022FFE57A